MAQYALPPGAVRRRTMFGLLDADGWTWATIKATFWFLLIIFLEGYVPDRAYYFTVAPTIDLGYNAISPVNLCPAENNVGNRQLPCPPPLGAVVPWQDSPPQLALPAGRTRAGTFASGENLYVVGGETPEGVTDSVLSTVVSELGNLDPWQEGPALPEPRAGAAVLNLSGAPYVVGGADASGNATDTVFLGTVEDGVLTGWEAADDLALPIPLVDLAGVPTGTGLYVFGGRTADGSLSAATYRSDLTTTGQVRLQPWIEITELPLPEARASATAISTGPAIYVLGGEGPDGVSNLVFYLGLDTEGHPRIDHETERPFGWGVSVAQSASAALPAPRADHATFTNSGVIYVIGGRDADGSGVSTNYWAVPDAADGTVDRWLSQEPTNLTQPRRNAAAAVVGPHAFVIGGSSGDALLDSTVRGGLAPQPPFFRLGLFGVTVPALSIKGEIGQQLGYIVAGSAALGNFVILVVIGWMYSHKPETFRFFRWVTRGRFRPPPDQEYRY